MFGMGIHDEMLVGSHRVIATRLSPKPVAHSGQTLAQELFDQIAVLTVGRMGCGRLRDRGATAVACDFDPGAVDRWEPIKLSRRGFKEETWKAICFGEAVPRRSIPVLVLAQDTQRNSQLS